MASPEDVTAPLDAKLVDLEKRISIVEMKMDNLDALMAKVKEIVTTLYEMMT